MYVAGAGQFIKNLREKTSHTQSDLAKIIGVNRTVIEKWENEYNRMCLRSLIKIAELSNVSRDIIYSLIDQGKFRLRRVSLPLKFDKIRNLVKWLIPQKEGKFKGRISLLKNCPDETHLKIKETLNINLRSNRSSKVITSRELYNYLTTFFSYSKVSKINPPLTNEVKHWYDKGLDLQRAVIIPCLQTDGFSMKQKNQKYIPAFSGNSKVLHDYFVDAMFYYYNELPTSYFIPNGTNHFTIYDKKIMNAVNDEIMNLAGNTKTSPTKSGQSAEEYLREPQPHLKYLINASEAEQKIALRIWASAEGFISIDKCKSSNNEYLVPLFGIACAHPVLAKQLQQISKNLSLPLYVKRTKRSWSGISRLNNATIIGCIKFLKFGGFIKRIKIGATSRYHTGIYKDILTLGILEYIKQRKSTKKWPMKLPTSIHHHNINKILKNREFKSADYYINYFS